MKSKMIGRPGHKWAGLRADYRPSLKIDTEERRAHKDIVVPRVPNGKELAKDGEVAMK